MLTQLLTMTSTYKFPSLIGVEVAQRYCAPPLLPLYTNNAGFIVSLSDNHQNNSFSFFANCINFEAIFPDLNILLPGPDSPNCGSTGSPVPGTGSLAI